METLLRQTGVYCSLGWIRGPNYIRGHNRQYPCKVTRQHLPQSIHGICDGWRLGERKAGNQRRKDLLGPSHSRFPFIGNCNGGKKTGRRMWRLVSHTEVVHSYRHTWPDLPGPPSSTETARGWGSCLRGLGPDPAGYGHLAVSSPCTGASRVSHNCYRDLPFTAYLPRLVRYFNLLRPRVAVMYYNLIQSPGHLRVSAPHLAQFVVTI